MTKVGRNDPCPCKSGLKYKRCCLPKHEAEARAPRPSPERQGGTLLSYGVLGPDDDPNKLDRMSNRVLDLIRAGELDQAEAACGQLREAYPHLIDWIERTGMVHEARGETTEAIAYYERCLQFMEGHPEGFEEASGDWHRRTIARLRASTDQTAAAHTPDHDP